ncbi:hypothetical protein BpHYR1_043749 [Brachionus plicatilis]|uniref:Uncharacterized protein n=1 Tax=Brachionus plicatilis TaxID=10195 RepID=A0A3M7RVS5_BRAPC|nr:hypothetical protein BpHYR1_043749 [Brachionus plicatilis]
MLLQPKKNTLSILSSKSTLFEIFNLALIRERVFEEQVGAAASLGHQKKVKRPTKFIVNIQCRFDKWIPDNFTEIFTSLFSSIFIIFKAVATFY